MQDFDAYYDVEYHLIPAQMTRFWEEDCRLPVLYDKNEWRGILTRLFTYDGFDWRKLQTRTYVNSTEPPVVILYIFPEPFRAPLAKYGAMVFNNRRLKYYTLELGFDGQYMYKGNSTYSGHILYSWDGQYVYKGRSSYSGDILYTWDGKHIFKGKSTYSGDILYTWDGEHLYKGNSTYSGNILYTWDGEYLYKGNSTYSGNTLATTNGSIPIPILLLML